MHSCKALWRRKVRPSYAAVPLFKERGTMDGFARLLTSQRPLKRPERLAAWLAVLLGVSMVTAGLMGAV